MKELNSKKLLLIDGIGALVSTLSLGVVLVQFQPYIGMPLQTLYLLAGLAGAFALYSLGSYFLAKQKWHSYLKIIAMVNLAYCLLTFGLVILNFQTMTWLGIGYFVLEILIILFLVRLELGSVKAETK